jgi:RimJ/RimL family protein N-acetyltransferase
LAPDGCPHPLRPARSRVGGTVPGVAPSPLRLSAGRLITDRLALDPLRVGDAEELAPLLDDPALHAYTGGAPDTVEQLRERHLRQVAGRSADGSACWLNWVVRRRDSGAAVGTVQATVTAQEDRAVAEVAWVVAAPHQRRGYAREGAGEMVRWLRDEGVEVVIAHVHPEHAASIAVARALGLRATDRQVDGEVRWEG